MFRNWLPAASSRLIAVRAVHGLVAPWYERNACFLATAGAGRGVHLARGAIVSASTAAKSAAPTAKATGRAETAAATLAVASFSATRRAALRVLIAPARVKLLVVRGKREVVSALDAVQTSVFVCHVFHLYFLVNVWSELEEPVAIHEPALTEGIAALSLPCGDPFCQRFLSCKISGYFPCTGAAISTVTGLPRTPERCNACCTRRASDFGTSTKLNLS